MCVQFVLASSRGIRLLVFPSNIVYINGLNQCESNNVENLILDHVPQSELRDIIQNSRIKLLLIFNV